MQKTASILTTAAEVRKAIRAVFADDRTRRVALVAFVGADAEGYIPSARGLELYCWPKAGGTNPYTLENLLELGVRIRFVDGLHTKIYWSKSRGVVIGSANLTNNALGEGGLVEAAVKLPSSSLEIDALVKTLKVARDFDARLRRLRQEHVLFCQHNESLSHRQKPGPVRKSPSFLEWWDQGPRRADWRLGWYTENADPPDDALHDYAERFERSTYVEWLSCPRKNAYPLGQFVLSVRFDEERGRLIPKVPRWWIPEFVTRSAQATKLGDHPYAAFAHRRRAPGTRPPFNCQDPRFLRSLTTVLEERGGIQRLEREERSALTKRELGRIATRLRRRPAS